jgi:AraC-like DNA-binding protein
MDTLPDVMHTPGDAGSARGRLASTLELLSRESESRDPGSEEIVRRLADALLAQALRAALLESSDGRHILAIRDRQVALAVGVIHRDPERAWTVGKLAGEVALSRSTFAARFRAAVGESPLRYLTRTRLAHAARLLRDTDASVAQVAARAGYGNEFSFGRPSSACSESRPAPTETTRSTYLTRRWRTQTTRVILGCRESAPAGDRSACHE